MPRMSKRPGRKPKKRGETPETLTPRSSAFLQLPGELRNEIYKFLFASTRLASGYRATSWASMLRIKLAEHSLAILRTCRQVNQEASSLWLDQVLFDFERPQDMLTKLSALSSNTISQIRHVRFVGHSLHLKPIGARIDEEFSPVLALKLLPTLRLNRLTVLGPSYFDGPAYGDLEAFVRYGNGWRELHYITPRSAMLGYGSPRPRSFPDECLLNYDYQPHQRQRKPQPSTWREILLERDGADSGASVFIYRSKRDDEPGAILNPLAREVFEQRLPSQQPEKFGVRGDKTLIGPKEIGKELLVVVKRHADIAEQETPPYALEQDFRHWANGMTWAHIEQQCSIGWAYSTGAGDAEIQTDEYNDVDEIFWNPLDYNA